MGQPSAKNAGRLGGGSARSRRRPQAGRGRTWGAGRFRKGRVAFRGGPRGAWWGGAWCQTLFLVSKTAR